MGERWRKLPPGKRIRSEVRGRIESDFSSLRRTIPGTFRRGVGDRDRDKTCSTNRSRLLLELVSIFVNSQHVAVIGKC